MDMMIKMCVSRHQAMDILVEVGKSVPEDRKTLYTAALNRVKYEFDRHDPVKPKNGCCGNCGYPLDEDRMYCANCGHEVRRTEQWAKRERN